ncbi:MAG: peptidase E [Pseudomonadota bacterium]|nr:peptidase E [Pseudomonadota bacterium]
MAARILAIGGGGFLMEDGPSPIDRHIVLATGRERPKICFISTPSGDAVDMIEKFYEAFERLGCEATHLAFFRKPFRSALPLAGFEQHLLAQDAIFVGGGNTKSTLAVWREWRLDSVLDKASRAGVLLSGMSAGALCWFQEGLTDSYWGAGLKPLPCLGLLPGGCCVHYSGEPDRRIRLHAEIASEALGPCVAIDDGAAVLYVDAVQQDVFSWRPGATAYQVFLQDQAVMEVPMRARSIA